MGLTYIERQRRSLTLRLVQMQIEAMQLGLLRTSHAIHDAVRVVGYERADIMLKKQADLIFPPIKYL